MPEQSGLCQLFQRVKAGEKCAPGNLIPSANSPALSDTYGAASQARYGDWQRSTLVDREGRKYFFFEKKKQKTFARWLARPERSVRIPKCKSFLGRSQPVNATRIVAPLLEF